MKKHFHAVAAITVAMLTLLPAHAGSSPAAKCTTATAHLLDKLQIKALPSSRDNTCAAVAALSDAMDALDERDFPNTQARDKPLAPKNYSQEIARLLRPITATGQTREAACALITEIGAKTADDAAIKHLMEITAGIDGACSKRLIAVLRTNPAATDALPPALFETPLKKQVVALPPDPANPQAKRTRSCFYYPGIMVKEVDWGEVGAQRQTLVLAQNSPPACNDINPGEAVIAAADWGGYFHGKKGGAFFFDGADTVNGGRPFAVYSVRGIKLFEDSYAGEDFQAVETTNTSVTLRYRRTWQTPCSLYGDAAKCWSAIMAETGLTAAARPDCSKAYKDEIKRSPQYASETAKSPAIIAYTVEAHFAAQKTTFIAQPGAVSCWLPQ